MELLEFVVLTIVFMALQDFCGTSMVLAESRVLKFWPGLFDGLNDFMNRYGSAITAGSVVKWGIFSWQTFVLVCATAVTSFFTTNESTQLANQVLPQRQGLKGKWGRRKG